MRGAGDQPGSEAMTPHGFLYIIFLRLIIECLKFAVLRDHNGTYTNRESKVSRSVLFELFQYMGKMWGVAPVDTTSSFFLQINCSCRIKRIL